MLSCLYQQVATYFVDCLTANTIRYANHLAFSIGALEFQIKEVESRLKVKRDRVEAQSISDLESGTDLLVI